jgi:molybdate transport repressor ModE-like protein
MLEPRRILTFREVARHGSFSEAARALSLSQPAVSQQVAALESELGLRLIERRPGGLALTDAGRMLLDHAEALSGRLDLASAQLRELAAAEAATLRVGASPSLLAAFVPAAVERVLAGRDGLAVEAREGGVAELAGAVAAGELHAALCFQDAAASRREHEGTERTDLFEEPFAALVPPAHRLARRRRIRLAELADDVWSMPSRSGMVIAACRAAGFEPRVGHLVTDPLATRGVVARGLAVTLTPASLAAELTGVGVLEVTGPNARRTVYALLPDSGASAPARDFLAALGAGPGPERGATAGSRPSGPRSRRP